MRTSWPTSAKVVSLGAGLGMVPLSEELLGPFEHKQAAFTLGSRFEFLSPGVYALAEGASDKGRVAYLETEFVAGEGFERSLVWSGGNVILGPLDGPGAINRALGALGVEPRDGSDPFERVGLGRYRSPNEWLRDA